MFEGLVESLTDFNEAVAFDKEQFQLQYKNIQILIQSENFAELDVQTQQDARAAWENIQAVANIYKAVETLYAIALNPIGKIKEALQELQNLVPLLKKGVKDIGSRSHFTADIYQTCLQHFNNIDLSELPSSNADWVTRRMINVTGIKSEHLETFDALKRIQRSPMEFRKVSAEEILTSSPETSAEEIFAKPLHPQDQAIHVSRVIAEPAPVITMEKTQLENDWQNAHEQIKNLRKEQEDLTLYQAQQQRIIQELRITGDNEENIPLLEESIEIATNKKNELVRQIEELEQSIVQIEEHLNKLNFEQPSQLSIEDVTRTKSKSVIERYHLIKEELLAFLKKEKSGSQASLQKKALSFLDWGRRIAQLDELISSLEDPAFPLSHHFLEEINTGLSISQNPFRFNDTREKTEAQIRFEKLIKEKKLDSQLLSLDQERLFTEQQRLNQQIYELQQKLDPLPSSSYRDLREQLKFLQASKSANEQVLRKVSLQIDQIQCKEILQPLLIKYDLQGMLTTQVIEEDFLKELDLAIKEKTGETALPPEDLMILQNARKRLEAADNALGLRFQIDITADDLNHVKKYANLIKSESDGADPAHQAIGKQLDYLLSLENETVSEDNKVSITELASLMPTDSSLHKNISYFLSDFYTKYLDVFDPNNERSRDVDFTAFPSIKESVDHLIEVIKSEVKPPNLLKKKELYGKILAYTSRLANLNTSVHEPQPAEIIKMKQELMNYQKIIDSLEPHSPVKSAMMNVLKETQKYILSHSQWENAVPTRTQSSEQLIHPQLSF